jgi:hypothetical protein
MTTAVAVMLFAAASAGAIVGAFAVSVASVIRQAELKAELSALRVEAELAREHADQLLSGGRFVRKYDSKTGASVYTFKAPVTLKAKTQTVAKR